MLKYFHLQDSMDMKGIVLLPSTVVIGTTQHCMLHCLNYLLYCNFTIATIILAKGKRLHFTQDINQEKKTEIQHFRMSITQKSDIYTIIKTCIEGDIERVKFLSTQNCICLSEVVSQKQLMWCMRCFTENKHICLFRNGLEKNSCHTNRRKETKLIETEPKYSTASELDIQKDRQNSIAHH